MSYDICALLKYNRIGNILYKNFNIHSAELTLVCLFVYEEMKKSVKTEGKKDEPVTNV